MWFTTKYKQEIKEFYQDITSNNRYITLSERRNIEEHYQIVYKHSKKEIFSNTSRKFRYNYRNINTIIQKNNEIYINEKIKKYQTLLFVKGYPLDSEQQRVVFTEEKNTLVLAGAGSGKTLTIIGRLKYLILGKNINLDEILCITFTNEAVKNLKQSIEQEIGKEIEVLTFHKLGYQTIKDFEPNIAITPTNTLSKIIDHYFEDITENEQLIQEIVNYFLFWMPYQLELKNIVLFDKEKNITTKEEIILCNYFYLNGVSYQVNHHHIGNLHFSTIFLKEKKIYLQFYPLFNNYFDAVGKIRTYHRIEKHHLIEFYPIDFEDNTIFEKIEGLIKTYQIKLYPQKPYVIYQLIKNQVGMNYFHILKQQLQTFIHLLKSNGGNYISILEYQTESLKNKNQFIQKKENLFFYLLQNIYMEYCNYLEENRQIDFDDMLCRGAEYVKEYGIKKPYKYIIIDEYQDTSYTRYALIKAIQKQTGASILAVGDDWQSIYRFTGCNLDMFLKFKDYYGDTEVLKIQTTYRNCQQLIDVAGHFIMQNKAQLKKKLHSNKNILKPIKVMFYENKLEILKDLLEILSESDSGDIFLLGRNHSDLSFLDREFKIEKNKIVFLPCPQLNILFYTIHASKGLEADTVIILNNEDKLLGFPNQIMEDKLFRYVLKNDSYPFEEERRLFYVALTRTKQNCYLLVPKKNPSCFFLELQKHYLTHLEYFPGNKIKNRTIHK